MKLETKENLLYFSYTCFKKLKMKLFSSILFFLAMTFISVHAISQEKQHEVIKEIKMEETDGKKVLTITTIDNGIKTEEVLIGAAAEARLAELQRENVIEQVKEEITVEDKNGVRTLSINRTINGETKTEVFVGEEADKRLKEMNITPPKTGQPKMIVTPEEIKESPKKKH